ncbi:hypothetical protein FGSG_12215 [Fusarium graminearum PH-1]|uniref:Chromosome 2, complete genome n=1 Tax=Gibberella zeae (strain ATCC MYA-4620 / CBS 123657 / FGSC 9075 / NRRL 31084 / PH-1) TaxID=229533 RepID=I1S5U4_GIBZE|nr:hypothetical protein FGSG_12215 [Fusarium graminearum PH-1]ESU08457.1 hypothetical protein FGSG_12215 [Fusarium graminearum PH-1]CEF79660.1 unnamed protein product [Fusarium graminearum]|eukprot:XP_011320956.1 hypothetical protein FGSG_12215 [Fusarium graminearum PH-1]
MESAGLAIGSVALVSLFKDCIDLYSMISAARELDEDAPILNIKLGVEKMLFLQWSDGVGLLEHAKFDTTFNDLATRETILSILLSNAQALQDTYGLVKHSSPTVSPASDSTPIEQFNEASENRLSRFLGDFNKFKVTHSGESMQPSRIHKAVKQFRWVVVPKGKFDGLINHLSYFNGALNSLAPRVSNSTFDLSSEDLSYVDSISQLDGIIQISVKQHPAIAKAAIAAKRNLIQRRILLRLSFARQDDRKDNINNR